jgi:hypothetical protein
MALPALPHPIAQRHLYGESDDDRERQDDDASKRTAWRGTTLEGSNFDGDAPKQRQPASNDTCKNRARKT